MRHPSHLSRVRAVVPALLLAAMAMPAAAESCGAPAGYTQCFHFKYSLGTKSTWTAVFADDGSMSFPAGLGAGPGTFSCTQGGNYVLMAYNTDGEHVDYAKVDPETGTMKGMGRAVDGDYMYSFATTPGACMKEGALPPDAKH